MSEPQPEIKPESITVPVAPPVVTTAITKTAPSSAQEEETQRTTAGQRRVNLIWEVTQALLALSIVIACLYRWTVIPQPMPELQGAALFTILGFYFGRTNHQKIGGVAGGDAGR